MKRSGTELGLLSRGRQQMCERDTGKEPAQAALDEGIELQVIKLEEAKKGFVLLPRRWVVVERSFGWLNRFRRLASDYERLPETLAGLHFVVFAMLMLVHAVPVLQSS
jgi:transposase